MAAARGDREAAREAYRQAIANLVDAFLENRQANSDLFVVAHRIGEALENIGGCSLEIDEARRMVANSCPIQALHSRVATSPGMVTRSTCSICGAGDLECDHIPGETYDGQECFRTVIEVLSVDHIALTQNPDFPSAFRMTPWHRLEEIEERLGERWEPGMKIYSHHCQECYGRHEYRPDDIDRSLWDHLGEAHELADEDYPPVAPGSAHGP